LENFTFHNPTRIVFGKGTEDKVGTEVKRHTSKVLLHYGTGSIIKSGLYQKVIDSLSKSGIEYIELPGAMPNPRLSLVQEGIDICKKEKIGFILAVGGGSAIDSAKAIAVGTCYEGNVWDFFDQKAQPVEALGVGVILTIPAAGSEMSNSMVITNEDGWFKRGCTTEIVRPKFAIMNPEITCTLSDYQTVCGIADIMAHVMERYFTNSTNVDFTDRLCEATMRAVIHNALLVLNNPHDYNARAEIMWAGTIAHNDLLSCGRIGDWSSHQIEHELSGIYDVPHGAGLSVVFPAWMKYVYRHDVTRFAQFAVRVFGVDYSFASPEVTALEGIGRLKQFFKSIGLPVSLKELDIQDDRLEEMAQKCKIVNKQEGTIGNFVKLNQQDILNILKSAL